MKVASDNPAAREASVAVVKAYLAARQAGGDGGEALLDEQVAWQVPQDFMLAPELENPVLHGRARVLFYMRKIAEEWIRPDTIRFSDERFIAAEDTVVHNFVFSATAHNGEALRSRSATVYTVEAGRIVKLVDYFDTAEWRAKVLPGVLGHWSAATIEGER